MNKLKDFTYIQQTKKQANNIKYQSVESIKLYFKQFQINHIICNFFNQWKYQFNLIQIKHKLNAKFQHERVLNIFINWKSQSENMINLRNKGKYYYNQKCIKIKDYYFVLWDNLFQIEQSKKSHIQTMD